MRAGTNLAILFVALVMGGIAAFLARDWLASHTAVAAVEDVGTVVVTKAALGFGDPFTADNIVEVPWPSKSLPDGAFTKIQDFMKDGRRVALSPFVRNEPVVASKVSAPNQRASLSTVIEPGKRAVTVAVDDVRGVAGFIFPGDFVDVVLTRTGNGPSGKSYSEVILQHIKVLGIDQLAEVRQERPTVAKAVTVELTPEQSLKILLATNVGKLSLILRQSTEKSVDSEQRVTESDLFADENAPAPVPTPVVAASEPVAVAQDAQKDAIDLSTRKITIVRALKGEDYTVPRDLR
jgi:pilus assembly protein CpaB